MDEAANSTFSAFRQTTRRPPTDVKPGVGVANVYFIGSAGRVVIRLVVSRYPG
jgi:hypothetical protein